MMKLLRYLTACALIFTSFLIWADELPNPEEDNLANSHLLDETCAGQCHQNESVSDELEFEYRSCIECHDTLANLEGRQHNIKHQNSEEMECVECHLPHEESDPKEMCIDCHDEDDEELAGFSSIRLERYFNLYTQPDHKRRQTLLYQ